MTKPHDHPKIGQYLYLCGEHDEEKYESDDEEEGSDILDALSDDGAMSRLDSSGSKEDTEEDTHAMQEDKEGRAAPMHDDEKDMFEEEPMSQNLLGGGGLNK